MRAIRRHLPAFTALLGVLLLVSSIARAAIGLDLHISGADGLDDPMYVTGSGLAGDDRLFVLARDGRIQLFVDGELLSTPYLDLRSKVDEEGEGGLLGLAFAPDFAVTGHFYVHYTAGNGGTPDDLESVVSRFTANGNPRTSTTADPSETILSPFPLTQPQNVHNGGSIHVYDDYLWVALGDGESNPNESQLDSSLLGKLLRFDLTVDPPTFEVVAKGLRNPYRWSFDRLTGDLYMADVGSNIREEVTVVAAADLSNAVPFGQTPPLNFGWPIEEGSVCLDLGASPPCGSAALLPPTFEYDHDAPNLVAVVGGVVYRGPEQSLQGLYFVGDWLSNGFWSFEWNANQGIVDGPNDENVLFERINQLRGFGEGSDGVVYVVEANNAVYRVPEPSTSLMNLTALATVIALAIFHPRNRRSRVGESAATSV